MGSWRSEFHLDHEFFRLGMSDDVRTQLLWDALSRSPDIPMNDDFSGVPAGLGPWSISRDRQGFSWTLKAKPTKKETLRWHLREWRTERSAPDAVRVALIGESAAGSWGYKGDYCLSEVLRTSLARMLRRPVEVVDLSLVNAVWDKDCLPAAHASMTLDPDVVVAFCGNNEARWLLPLLAVADLDRVPSGYGARWSFLHALPAARVELLQTAYLERLSTSMARTISLVRAFGKELVFVIPPFNLRDWSPPETVPHHLQWTTLRTWREAMLAGERLRRRGEFGESERAFATAVKIDGGLCQQSLHQLGRTRWAVGADSAGDTLYRGVSAGFGPFVNAVPSMPSFGRQRQIELLEAFKVPYVDMHTALHQEGCPQGREAFLDYCHLSAMGHDMLVERVCRTLMQCEGFSRLAPVAQATVTVDQPTEHECALAALMAAIHNYQNGQERGLVKHWLALAVRHEAVSEIVDFFADTVCTSYRERITLATLRNAGLVDAFLNDRFLIFGLKFLYHERFDIDLLRLIEAVRSAEASVGARVGRQTRGLLRSQQFELKSLFYLDHRKGFSLAAREMSRRGWEQVGQDFVAYDLQGEVEFSLDDPADVSLLRVVASPPWPGTEARAEVFMNGQALGSMGIRHPFDVAELHLSQAPRLGGNHLRFEWGALFCPAEIEDLDDRQRYWLAYGPYPLAATIHEMSLVESRNGIARISCPR